MSITYLVAWVFLGYIYGAITTAIILNAWFHRD